MYYEITIYYNAEVENDLYYNSDVDCIDIFSVDKDELLDFINFITTRINNLLSFNVVVKHLVKEEPKPGRQSPA